MLEIGQIVHGRYKIRTSSGVGGFGAVYKVWDFNLERNCAIKENLHINEEALKQFKREATMLANLSHPHLARVTDYFTIPDQGQYLVMDYIEGSDLQKILNNFEGSLPVQQSLLWIHQICRALEYIHNQTPPIIHRDIKPGNIRITPQGNAVLVDFGLAKNLDDGAKTAMGARGFTPHYAAPEQYGFGGTDVQTDIYAIGATLYTILTYIIPSESVEIMLGNAGPPPLAKLINPTVSDSLSEALIHAMQIRPADRYRSIKDFKAVLKQELTGLSRTRVSPAPKPPLLLMLNDDTQFVLIPKGEFIMGCDHYDEESPQHRTDIPYDYWMARFPVTNLEYYRFGGKTFLLNEEEHPVTSVSWFDAQEYVDWLNAVYTSEIPEGYFFRLPSEAEWEKAARGNQGYIYLWGNLFDRHRCNTLLRMKPAYETTTPVGFFSPQDNSPFGAADMAGNVWEWTRSLGGRKLEMWRPEGYHYPYHPFDGRENEYAPEEISRILRGGSFAEDEWNSRSSTRIAAHPGAENNNFGFRVMIAPDS